MPVMAIARLHVMMIVVHDLLADHIAEFIRVNLPVMMIVMDHIGVAVSVDLGDTIFVVLVRQSSRIGGQHQRRRTKESKQFSHV